MADSKHTPGGEGKHPPRMDGRRSRWIAFDVFFFANDFGADLLDRFGPAGVTVFVAYLCACKRNNVQGQFSYSTEADALGQLGVSVMPLVDLDGNEWTLDDLWTFTGDRKLTRRTSRRHLTNVVATRWERWQQGYKSQTDSERKGTSKPGNTAAEADTDTESDKTRQDNDLTLTRQQRQAIADETMSLLVDRDVERAIDNQMQIQNHRAFRNGCRKAREKDHMAEAHRLLHDHPDWLAGDLADVLDQVQDKPVRKSPPKCDLCRQVLGANHTDLSCRAGQKYLAEQEAG